MTAVFPIRFPVPTTAIDGTDGNGRNSGGRNSKSEPMYRSPRASASLAQRIRSRGPSTGSSERSTTASAPTSSSDSTSRTP